MSYRRHMVCWTVFGALIQACSADAPSSVVSAELATSLTKEAPLLLARGTAPPNGDARYIVMLKQDVGDHRNRSIALAKKHAKSTHQIYEHAIHGFAATLSPGELKRLRSSPEVASIEVDRLVRGDGTDYTPGWGLDRIDQRTGRNNVFSSPYDGTGVTIYVVGTGVQASHPDFGGRVTAGYSAPGSPPLYSIGSATAPCHHHETRAAGIAAGAEYGVAKNASIVPVRATHDYTPGLGCVDFGFISNFVAAVNWVIGHHTSGPAVLTFSFSWPDYQNNFEPGSVNIALKNAKADGIFVAVSAGNEGGDSCGRSPADVYELVTVGATDVNDAKHFNGGNCIDIWAPGVGISTADLGGGYTTNWSGNSASTPFVSGVAALLLQQFPNDTPDKIAQMITGGSTINIPGFYTGPPGLLYSTLPSTPEAVIVGMWLVGHGEVCTWTASVRGGRTPYTYQWSGVASGTTFALTQPVYFPGSLYLQATDVQGRVSPQASIFVSVDQSGQRYCTSD